MKDGTSKLTGSKRFQSIRRVDSKRGSIVPEHADGVEKQVLKYLYEENSKLKAELRARQLQEKEEAEIARLKAENTELHERLAQPKVRLEDL